MRAALLTLLLLAGGGAQAQEPPTRVTVGSKKFTESVILGELARLLAEDAGLRAAHLRELGGTRVLWSGLLAGELDVYAEYTGTIAEELFAGRNLQGLEEIRAALAEEGVGSSLPLGFNNTYALGMREDVAGELGLLRISDLAAHPDLRFGFGSEFMERGDGWPGLRSHYGLENAATGLDHDLAYRGLESGDIQVMDVYTTDAEIRYYGLRLLEDDHGYFPEYQALWVWRADLVERAPELIRALRQLEGRIPAPAMVDMNKRVKIDGTSEVRTAAGFLDDTLGIEVEFQEETRPERILRTTLQHLYLVGLSLFLATLAAVPLGVLAARLPRLGQGVLAAVGVLQTIPSLALLALLIPFLGLGAPPTLFALFLYSLLPIVRNTHAGLTSIPRELFESAEALGLSARARLFSIELPMASRVILAGVKISAVINVGTATLAAIIGAGGYGQSILTGIRLDDYDLIAEGALASALLALAVQAGFDLLERFVVPAGLRLEPAE